MDNKTKIEFSFCDKLSGIIKVSVSVISLVLDYSGYHKNFIQLLFKIVLTCKHHYILVACKL